MDMRAVIVDDEAIVRLGIRHALDWQELGIANVEEAAHGKEVLDHWQQWQPDLLVTDIKMPVMDGIALIKAVKKRAPDCICVVLSCADEFVLVKEALLAGAVDYLLKMTMRPAELMESMRKILQDQRVRQLDTQQQDGNEIRRQAFFSQWLTGRYSHEDMEAMVHECGVRHLLLHYYIAVLQVNPVADRQAVQQHSEAWQKVEQWLMAGVQQAKYLLFRAQLDTYIMLWGADEIGQQGEELAAMIQRGQAELAVRMRAGISAPARQALGMKQALEEARQAVKAHLFVQSNPVVHFREQDDPHRKQDAHVRMQFDQDFRHSLTQALLSENEQTIATIIDRFFALLRPALCGADTARDCIDKTLAILNVAAMEMAARTGQAYQHVEEFAGDLSIYYWDCESAAALVRSYCQYLLEIRSRQGQPERNIVKQMQRYIQQHYAEKLTLDHLASRFHLNKNYVCQRFKLESGMNFTRYLNHVRITKAKELILYSDLNVQEIAEQSGFADFRYFSRVFRNHTGLSPTAFKQNEEAEREKLKIIHLNDI